MRSASIKLPHTLEELKGYFNRSNEAAINLTIQYPSIADLYTFDFFHDLVWEIRKDLVLKLCALPGIAKLIDNEEKFIKICNADFQLTVCLIEAYPHIAKIAEPIIAFMPHYYLNQNQERVKKRILSSESIAALDLAEIKKDKKETLAIEDKKFSVIERMILNEFDKKKGFHILLRTFPTVKKYCDRMMYGSSGYYATGKVDFKNDFDTFGSASEEVIGFSAAMVYQLFHIRNNLIKDGKLKTTDSFNVLECGGGNGDLCYHIFLTIKRMAQYYREWQQLLNTICYHLVDVSPALIKRQEKRNEQLIKLGKVKVIKGNVLKPIDELADTKIAAILSNELLDMFAPQEVRLNDEGNIVFSIMIPIIDQYLHNKYLNDILQKKGLSLDKLVKESEKYKSLYLFFLSEDKKILAKDNENFKESLFLSEASFLKLHEIAAKEKECANLFDFNILCVIDTDCDSELAEFLKRNPTYTDRMRENNTRRYPDIGIHEYLQSMYNLLIPGGEIITVDYGDTDYLVPECLHTFSAGKQRGNDFRANPGSKDITKFVNFSTLAREGKLSNFASVFYGKQAQLAINQELLTLKEISFYQTVCTHEDKYKVMVQRKHIATEEKSVNLPVESSRFYTHSLPVSHGQLFMSMQQTVKKLNIQQMQKTLNYFKTTTDKNDPTPEMVLRRASAGQQPSSNCTMTHLEVIQYLFAHVKNLNINAVAITNSRTALHWAVIKKQDEIAAYLLSLGANPNIEDKDLKTAKDYGLDIDTLKERYPAYWRRSTFKPV